MSIGMILNWMNWTASDAARPLYVRLHVLWYIDCPCVVSAEGISI